MAAGVSLRQVATNAGVSYETARMWAKEDGWLVVRPAVRSQGICALYHVDAVINFLGEREDARQREAA